MLAITKFMTDRKIAGKTTTAKDIASKFKTRNAQVIAMLAEAQNAGEMTLAMDTETFMAKTRLEIVSLNLEVSQDLGIADDFGKPAGFHYVTFEETENMAKKNAVAEAPVIELDESGSGLDGAGDTADGEGALETTEQWYEGVVTEGELPPVVKTGRKTRTQEQIAADEAAKAAKKAEREQKAAEREAAKAEAKAAREASKQASKEAREKLAAERRAAIAAGGPGLCRVCHKPLTQTDSVERGIGPVCMGRLARFSGVTVADLVDEEKTSEEALNTMLGNYAEHGSPVEVFATEAEALQAHPEGVVKFSEFYKAVEAAGISPRRLMKATGGDRSEGEVLSELWMPFIIGTTRKYLSKNVEAAMDELRPQETVPASE